MTTIIYPAAFAFAVAFVLGRPLIGWLQRLRAGQVVRQHGPKTHLKKAGTPTMGGLLIMAGAVAATAAFTSDLRAVAPLLVALVGFGAIGILDDVAKLMARRSLGLKARQKLVLQLVLALIVGWAALERIGPHVRVPFVEGWWTVPEGLYWLLAVGTMVGTANAVNITDGLDGLAAGAAAVAALTMGAIALVLGFPDVAVFAAAVGGACLGFAWFNAHPAQVIMGDTGSMALGGALGAVALMSGTPLLLAIVGGLFVVETLSVIVQVAYFRWTGGRRILRMSPLHHHFELGGWAEPQVVIRFWLVCLAFAAAGLLSLR
ncbi:MAG: phospho-N-acetylmuramoyl-pentapeptide-transferase [Limnochordales bacterium]|nr:phospho-N-acetylmuramoyl-pentapeptide-transferase [Limnochordales bacterium]